MTIISKQSAEKLIFKPKQLPQYLRAAFAIALLIPISLAGIVITFILLISGKFIEASVPAFFTIVILWGVFNVVLSILPDEGRLTIDVDGFECYSRLKSRRLTYQWSDVKHFRLTYQRTRYKDFPRITAKVFKGKFTHDKHITSYSYETPLEEIIQTLNGFCLRSKVTPKEGKLYIEDKIYVEAAHTHIPIEVPQNEEKGPDYIQRVRQELIGVLVFGVIFGGLLSFTHWLSGPRQTFKFYNLAPNSNPSIRITMNINSGKNIETYYLPPLLYRNRLELRIPSANKSVLVQYTENQQTQCTILTKRYGIWNQMDGIWIHRDGQLWGYTNDSDYVEYRPCPEVIPIGNVRLSANNNTAKETAVIIKPMKSSDYKRLKKKTGYSFEDY